MRQMVDAIKIIDQAKGDGIKKIQPDEEEVRDWAHHSAYYIEDSLKKTNTKVTKLAQGLPVGGEIESLDDGTLYSAFKNRTGIKTNSD